VPAFEYKALDNKGRAKKGILEADSARQIRQQLREQGLTPLEVTTSNEVKRSSDGKESVISFSRKISTADLSLITRQLATLIQAALPLEEALKAVAQQCDKPKVQSVILSVRSRVVEGFPLAESMAEFPLIFDKLFCAMVAAGEKSGHLDTVLDRLADYTEKRQQMRMKLMQAMIYPAVLTLVAVGVIAILLAAVVPQVVGQFEHMNQELPQITRILIFSSDFIRDYGLIVLGLIFVSSIGFKQLLKKDATKLAFHAKILRIPVIGKVSKSLNTARFARTLSILSSSAVPLLEGMSIAANVLTNEEAQRLVTEAAGRVREGASLHSALDASKLFPPMMLHMIASGERSGELEGMLVRAADTQDKEFEMQVNVALGIFEPALIISMAGVVLFIVMAILTPILALNDMV